MSVSAPLTFEPPAVEGMLQGPRSKFETRQHLLIVQWACILPAALRLCQTVDKAQKIYVDKVLKYLQQLF